jgi:predicted transcriptional regulator
LPSDILKRLRANAGKREAVSSERDALILEAAGAKIPVTHIAQAVGLTRQQVHRIISNGSKA